MAKNTEERAAIVSYLAAIDRKNAPKPRGGRRRTTESIGRDITTCEQTIASTMDPIRKLHATQELLNLQHEAEQIASDEYYADPTNFEADFIAHLSGYADRNAITASALRRVGVPARVIREAGLT